MPLAKRLALLGVLSLASCAAMQGVAGENDAQPFTAVYALGWHGFAAGESTLTLSRTGPQTYEYRSIDRAHGLFRLAFPDPISESSTFTFSDGHVRPLSYREDNGPGKADQNVRVRFHWSSRRVLGTEDGKPVDQPLEPGTQDPLSVQIELMHALAAGKNPTHFLLFDKDSAKQYDYTRERSERLDTSLGPLGTVVYRSDRPGSDRVMRLWLAPSLGYLPVRAERRRKGNVEFTLSIRELQRGPSLDTRSGAPAG